MAVELKPDDEFFTLFQTQFIFFNKKEILKALKEAREGLEQKIKKQEPKKTQLKLNKEEIEKLIKEVKKELKPKKAKKKQETEEEIQIKEVPQKETIIEAEYNRLIEQEYNQQLDYSNLFSYLGGGVKINEYEPFEKKKEEKSGFMNEEDAGRIVETIAKQQAINSGEYVKPEDKEKFELYAKLRWDIVNMKLKHTAYGNVNVNMDKINY